MDSRLFCQFVLILVVTSLRVVRPQCGLECTPVTSQSQVWVSNLRLLDTTQDSLMVQWDPDTVGGEGYFVQFRVEGAPSFTTATVEFLNSSVTSFNIEGLSSSTMYNIRVCREVATSNDDNCGTCVLCAVTRQPEVPPSAPQTLTTTTTPESISLNWEIPSEVNDDRGIANYSVTCLTEGSNQTAVVFRTSVRFSGLAPSTRFDCSVVAFNRFGASSAAIAVAVTSNRTSDPGALFIFLKPRLVYRTITTTLITSSALARASVDDSPLLLEYNGDLEDMDYDYRKNLLYFSAVETNGMNVIKVVQIQSNLMSDGAFVISTQGSLENLHELSAGVAISHITVDWVNSELYYVESSSSSSRIMRLILNETGVSVLSQSCVVEQANTVISNIKVDAVHGFFYYGTDTMLFRTELSNIQVSSMSCQSSISPTLVRTFTALFDFTIQQNEAIYILGRQLSICSENQNGLALAINLGEQNMETFGYGTSPAFDANTAFDSYTQFMIMAAISATGSTIVFVPIENNIVLGCGIVQNVALRTASTNVSLIHVFRESQQPIPTPLSPPSSIKVSTEGSTAAVIWAAPSFPGDIFSADAFDDWTYSVRYCTVNTTQTCLEETTTELSIQLSLSFNTSYLVSVRAVGPGGASTVSSESFFTTEPDGIDARLVIAHERGILRSSLAGQSVEMLAESTPVSVAVDAYDGVIYWASEGSSATIYSRRGSIMTSLYSRRDQPFGLEYDWVGNKILWVEDGENPQAPLRSFIGQVLPTGESMFGETAGAVGTVMDSYNGLFFWTNRSTIHMRTLSGIPLEPCFSPSGGASSLAVDATRRNLYWLSNSATTSQRWKISQLDYSGTECNPASLVEQDLTGLSLSSSSTVMVYASNKLYFTSRLSNKIYTVSSRLDDVGVDQSLAMGEVKLTGVNIAGTLEIRDMAVQSTETQPLPGLLTSQNRGVSGLAPSIPSVGPSLNVMNSTESFVLVEWEGSMVSGVTDAVIYYEVSYSLSSVINGSMTVRSAFITIPVPQPSTDVSVSVVPISVWARSTRAGVGSFTSLPSIPGQVMNVRVFLYTPLIMDRNTRTALVTWNNVAGDVSKYIVRVIDYNTGMDLNLYQVILDVRLSYSVLTADIQNFPPTFPLMVGRMYGVEVSASNDGGTGPPSERVNFTVSATGMRYPMQVLSLESSGMQYYGLETTINQPLNVESNAGPIVADAVDRRVYWYERNLNLIFSQLLGIGGARQSFLMISADRTVVSLAYDWIAKMLYVSRVVTATGQLDLLRVEIYDADVQEVVFPMLQLEPVGPTAVVNSEINPVTGFFFWSITENGVTRIYALDLRNSTISTITPVVRSPTRRRRRRRNVMMDVTPALALNPLNNNLLVSDRASGDILQCPQAFDTCSSYVSRLALQTNSGRMDVGLPAGSIKYGGQFIYWTSENSSVPGIFAVDVSDLTMLIVVNNQATPNFFVPLSPDQQPIPPLMCLSPNPSIPSNRQDLQLDSATSTTLTLSWRNRDQGFVGISCDPSTYFSLASFVFTVSHERSSDVRVQQMTRRRSIVLSDLIPFTNYIVGILALNPYTITDGATDFFFFQNYKTREGVPDPPIFELFNVTGTTTAGVQWSHVLPNALRGSIEARSYIVSVGNVNLTTSSNSIIVSGPKAALLNVKLYSFNNVSVSSTGTEITIQLWSLVQQPALIMAVNDTIVVNVTISDTFIGEIEGVGISACVKSLATVVGSICKCVYSNNTEDYQPSFFQTISMVRPVTLSFMLVNLSVFTDYCVLPIGLYSTDEVAGGEGIILTTASGVPNAPVLNLTDKSMLTWNHPPSNGNPITSYTVIFRPNARLDVEMTMMRLNSEDTTYNLDIAPITRGVEYRIVLVATNGNGNSEESNEVNVEFPVVFPVAVVAASAAVGGTVLLSICIIIVLICCFLKARNNKRELRLSYMYGPDHELSNLRNAISRSNGQNPHYTWSFDDYQYSDDHLNLLTKFPRNNLKLETFIDRGEFGEVFQGTATDILGAGTGPTPVAVKTLRKGATTEEQRKFLAEASLMGNFNHPNILKVLGVCVDNDPVYIILELMPGGDLLKFLRKAKMDHGPTLLTLPEQIQVALDVAHGCFYLEQQHFIHRDIAARNCLVSSKGADRVVKIGDFGLAKDLYSSDYYQVEGQRKLPVRWMAPEALLQGKFTVESDIWSYGVLLWEIMTLGNQPYPGRINQEVLQFVTGGGRLDRPDKCPSKIYQLMQSCWRRYASDRPHFEHIVNTLTAFLERLKRPDSIYNSDSDSDDEESNHVRQGSNKLPARTPSIRSTGRGIMNLARSGSMKLRNSFRRHNSTQKREEHMTNSQQDDFRERGPF